MARKTPAERFARFVDTNGPWSLRKGAPGRCHLWTGSTNGKGYGTFWDAGTRRAYRWIYAHTHGPIAPGLDVDHRCRNRLCVNVAHLEAVSHRVNVLRSSNHVAARAAQTHCIRGHRFSKANTRRRANGTRQCRACTRIRNTATTANSLEEAA